MTRCLLLDIEGTTCPISFVADVLFPYASQHLESFLQEHGHDTKIAAILEAAWQEWKHDPDPRQQSNLRQLEEPKRKSIQAITHYLQDLIAADRKSTALKDLQGHLWSQGFQCGAIQARFYPETIRCLQQWHQAGLQLAVYSSGSIQAQQLLYGHTEAGDLRRLFCGWFDTRTGNKKEASSYTVISDQLQCDPQSITFISDSRAECDAAKSAGLKVLFSLRPGNPDQDPGRHTVITSLDQVIATINTTPQR
jgi:enolase-phosphatase E1